MNLLGYLITISNIQSYEASGGPIKDLSINIGDMQTLSSEITALADFQVEDFKDTGFFRVGHVGKYLSKNLREYIYQGVGDPADEAVVLTVHFNEKKLEARDDSSLSFLLHRGTVDEDDREEIQSYLDNKNATENVSS